MTDFNNYNNTNEKILHENIPSDLFKLYNLTPYESQRNPSTQHYELHNNRRRSKLYDYGNAIYKVISAEEAIQLVKQNREEIQNLRIIFDDNLVEYELRNNGSIYAIYRSLDHIFVGGKEYKNVGFAPWQAIVRAASKIYWTDEYARKIPPENIEKRNEKNIEKVLFKPLLPNDPGYDVHRPYDNLKKGETIKLKNIPDTGEHKNGLELHKLYIEYDLARKALKKLEREKNTYDEEEYEMLKVEYEAIKQEALKNYNLALNSRKIRDTHKVKNISTDAVKFNNKIMVYTQIIQDALTTGYELKKELDQLLTTTTNTSLHLQQDLSIMKKTLRETIENLKADNQQLNDSENESEENDSEELIKQLLDDIEDFKVDYINRHLAQLADIEAAMKEVDDVLNTHRPNTAARKARNIAASSKELDSDLLDIIEFDDFSN